MDHFPAITGCAGEGSEGIVFAVPVWTGAIRAPFYGAQGVGECGEWSWVRVGEGEAGVKVEVGAPAADAGV